MAFVILPGIKGKVYVPDIKKNAPKKHPCRDCAVCQFCSNTRCDMCLSGKKKCMTKKKQPALECKKEDKKRCDK